ncbi:integrin beta-1-like isoform X2 [Halichondria panicea]
MYLLMDLTLTMQEDLRSIRQFAGDLVARMKVLSSDFRIGFGSFIDKTVAPFADTINTEFPCAEDAEVRRITAEQCDPVYAFRHRLDLTDNATLLQEQLDNALLSASPDHPESLLDALLQVAVCESEVGWRVKGQSRRIVLAITDGDYHYALDGKLGGLVAQPDAQCRLSSTGEYEDARLYDYPSSAFISDVLNDNRITPIFAVPSQVRSVYDGLAAAIRSASVGTLAADASDIITLVEDQYRILASTVVPLLSTTPELPPDMLSVTVLPLNDCGLGALRVDTADVCESIVFPNTVDYRVTVSAAPEACRIFGNQSISAQIQFIGFGNVDIDISLACDCGCGDPEPDSAMCNGEGTFECSTCICDDNIGGVQCTCPVGGAELGCIDPLDMTGSVCNGVGQCECGECVCDQISQESELVFQGSYCQYNPLNCPIARDDSGQFKPCAGHGECINSVCQCNEQFTGGACECTLDNSTCMDPAGIPGDDLCSGEGECQCGLCICNDYSLTFGRYCEECVRCRTSCSRVSPCVRCSLLPGVECSDECEGRVTLINDTTLMASDLKVCSVREGSCEVRYRISEAIEGDESDIFVVLDMGQSALSVLLGGSADCNPAPLIWPIFVGIILGIVVVGILAVVLWRCCTYLGEYLEYRQWMKSVEDQSARTGDNPLFVDPNAKYQNPRYRGQSS